MADTVQVILSAKDLASPTINTVGQQLGGLNTHATNAGGGFARLASGAGLLATGLGLAGVAAGGALVAGLGGAVGKAQDFQQSMADVNALLQGTPADMALLSDAAIKLGMDTSLSGIGATDAAKAMGELAAAGFNAGDIAGGAAKGVLLLASATGTDIPTAAQIAGDTFNQFRQSMGLTADDMPRLADLLTGAANASSISLTDIGESMKYIGPVAASMGISMEDVTATIAELGNQGIKGSSAGTAMRSMLVSLASPSKEAAGTIKDLGLQFFDSQGKIKDFAGISEELKTKLAGMTDQQRASALATIFGKEALSAATVLYGEGAEGVKKYLDQITKTGSAADTGAIRNNTLKGSVDQLKAAFETGQIALGQAFLPALKGLVDWAAQAVSAAIPLVQQYGPVLVGWLQQGIGILTQWGGAIWSAVSAVVGAFQSFTSGKTTLAEFIGGMETFASTILGKLGNLAALAAPYIGQFFGAIGGAIATYGPQLLAQVGIWAGYLVNWITDTAIPWLLPKLAAFGEAIWGWITGTAVPTLITTVTALGLALANWVTETAIPFLQTNLPQWLSTLGGWITGTAFPAVVGFITPLATKFGTWVTETAIPFLLTNVPLWIAALVGWWYGTAVPTALAFLVDIGQKFGTWVSETAVPYLQANIPKWLLALGDYLTGTALPALGTSLMTIGQKFGTWVTETAVPWLQTNIPLWLSAISDYLTGTALPAIGTKATELGQGLVNKFMDAAGAIIGKVSAKMGEVPGAITSGLGDLGGLLVNAGASLIGGLISGIQSKISALKNLLGGITNSLPDWKGPADKDAALLYDAGRLVLGGFIEGMEAKLSAVRAAAGTVTTLLFEQFTGGLNQVQALVPGFASQLTASTAVVQVYREAMDLASVAINVAREAVSSLVGSLRTVPNDMAIAFTTPGLTEAITGARDLAVALANIPTSISTTISVTTTGGGGATPNFNAGEFGQGLPDFLGGFRADGGPVSANVPYVVGERGPELFVPYTSGAILPSGSRGGGGGGGPTIVINVAGSVISEGQLVDRLQSALVRKLRSNLTTGIA